ncbi:MAG: hypothetical protein AAF656_01380 [Planctomycetota bacterium]
MLLWIITKLNEHMGNSSHAERRATRALAKFMREHEAHPLSVQKVEAVLGLLEQGDLKMARKAFDQIPIGGNGCINDWWPSVVYPHEDQEYVDAVFQALINEWVRLMNIE